MIVSTVLWITLFTGVIFFPPSSSVLYFDTAFYSFTLCDVILGVTLFRGDITDDFILVFGRVVSCWGRSLSLILWALPRIVVGLKLIFLFWASIALPLLFMEKLFTDTLLFPAISYFLGSESKLFLNPFEGVWNPPFETIDFLVVFGDNIDCRLETLF